MKLIFLALVGACVLFGNGPTVLGKKAQSSIQHCSSNKTYGSLDYKHFGVRTLYKTIYELPGNKLPSAANRTNQTLGCTPTFIYMITRHGARYPHRANYEAQQKLFEYTKMINSSRKAKLCDKDLEALRQWHPWVDEYVSQNQTKYGNREIKRIARRFIAMLPEIFPLDPDPKNYRFSSSDHQRTKASMKVFAKQIFAKNKKQTDRFLSKANLEVRPIKGDTLIRFAKTCKKFSKSVLKNATRFREFNKFMKGPVGEKILRSVASRLGIKRKQLNPELVYSMYFDGCCLQQWVDTVNGPWCNVFSKKDLRDLDYASDLREYWLRSNEVSQKMSCDLAKDVVTSLKEAARAQRKQTNHTSGKFLFGHVTTLMSLLANMQLFDMPNVPLTAGNHLRMRLRNFKLSEMMPSAGNLAFILYKCQGENRVQAFWNEREIRIPGCSEDNFVGNPCSLRSFLSFYANFHPKSDSKCSFENICSVETDTI